MARVGGEGRRRRRASAREGGEVGARGGRDGDGRPGAVSAGEGGKRPGAGRAGEGGRRPGTGRAEEGGRQPGAAWMARSAASTRRGRRCSCLGGGGFLS